MALPVQHLSTSFNRVMRGYDPEEVDDALRDLDDDIAEARAAREAAEADAARLRGEVAALQVRVAELEAAVRTDTPQTMTGLGERLLLVLAETEQAAAERLHGAEAQAAVVVAAAQEEAARVLSDAAATSAEADARATAVVADAESRAAEAVAVAEGRAATLLAAADARAAAAEEAAERWARQRRCEVEAWEADVRAVVEADRVRAATEFARMKLAWKAELDELARRRDDAIGRLDDVAAALRDLVLAGRATSAIVAVDDTVPGPVDLRDGTQHTAAAAPDADTDAGGDVVATGDPAAAAD